MCRIACLPAGFSRKDAIRLGMSMLGSNTDGTSVCYVKDKKFVIQKYPYSLEHVLKRNNKFMSHIDGHDGWTLLHLRKASVGLPKVKFNCHGFISSNGKYCGIHNGTCAKTASIIRMALAKNIHWSSQVDSEPLLELLARVGVAKFLNAIEYAGVFASLHRKSGCLSIVKTNYASDLEFLTTKDGQTIISSEFPQPFKAISKNADEGYYILNKEGFIVKQKKKEWQTSSTTSWRGGGTHYVNTEFFDHKGEFPYVGDY